MTPPAPASFDSGSGSRAPERGSSESERRAPASSGGGSGSGFLSRSPANEALLGICATCARSRGRAGDGQIEGPRFGALSELSERAPIHLFDHPQLERLGAAFTDGRHVFLSAKAAEAEPRSNPAGDPLMTLYVRALALIGGLDLPSPGD